MLKCVLQLLTLYFPSVGIDTRNGSACIEAVVKYCEAGLAYIYSLLWKLESLFFPIITVSLYEGCGL